jgi:hypothetical protein
MDARRIYSWFGGRKNLNGYLMAVLLTVAYHRIEVKDVQTFEAYALWLCVCLLGTGVLHVMAKAKGGDDA